MNATKRLPDRRGWCDPSKLPKGENGRALCRRCGTEVPKGCRTFCSSGCVDAWRSETDPSFQRRAVFDRDRGVCAICTIDTHVIAEWRKFAIHVVQRPYLSRNGTLRDWSLPGFAERLPTDDDIAIKGDVNAETRQQIIAWLAATDPYAARGVSVHHGRSNLWDMDHTVPVVEGGGGCDLSNLRTLCIPCHKAETKALAARRAAKRKAGVE